jgi:ribonuclease VapC
LILDSSAILCIILEEPEAEALIERMRHEDYLGVGAPTLTETGIVLGSRVGFDKIGTIANFLRAFQVQTLAFTPEHWQSACTAYQVYGKGRHPASLNFGDCLSYASAKLAGQTLLYIGQDFAQTDLA